MGTPEAPFVLAKMLTATVFYRSVLEFNCCLAVAFKYSQGYQASSQHYAQHENAAGGALNQSPDPTPG